MRYVRRLLSVLFASGFLLTLATVTPGVALNSAVAQTSSGGEEKSLRVSIVDRKPFAMRDGDSHTGFSIDLWKLIAEDLGRAYEIKEASTFSKMLNAVKNGDADLAIANISITAQRERELDFSQPIFDSGLQMMVPATGDGSGLFDAIFSTRMLTLVLIAVGVLFLVGNLMWFFERNKSPYFQKSYREGLWPSFFWAMHALISGGFEEHVPKSIPGRILGTALLISTLFLVSAFVATLTSAMTLSELRSDIQSLSDLHGKRVGTTRDSTASKELQAKGVDHQPFDDIEAMFTALRKGELDAVVHDAPVLSYYSVTRGKGLTEMTGKVFRPQKYGIALPQESPMVEQINRSLLNLRESGSYQALIEKWFGE